MVEHQAVPHSHRQPAEDGVFVEAGVALHGLFEVTDHVGEQRRGHTGIARKGRRRRGAYINKVVERRKENRNNIVRDTGIYTSDKVRGITWELIRREHSSETSAWFIRLDDSNIHRQGLVDFIGLKIEA